MTESQSLLAAADATENPNVQTQALLAYGFANSDANPSTAYDVLGRGLAVAQASGNRQLQSHFAVILSRLAAKNGDPMDAFDLITKAIRNFYDCGSFGLMPSPLAILAAFFDKLGDHQPAAIISGFAVNPLTQNAFPEFSAALVHLREVLGEEHYESLARVGASMTNSAVVNYAFEQIDQTRARLGQTGGAR